MLRRGDNNPNKNNGISRHPVGRPTSYRPEYAERVYDYALLGATEEEMGRIFHVSRIAIQKWRHRYPEFDSAIKSGREIADANVSKSMYRSALGYSHPAVKIFMTFDKDGNPAPYRVPYVEHHPPNPTSMIFWLKNRRPDLWRDRKDVAMTGPDGGPIDVRISKIESRVIDADCVDITDQVSNGEDRDAGVTLPVVRTNVR